jgi:hypothetical protein
MSIELKIKSKHLSEESKIIRFEEYKLLKQIAYNRKQHYTSGNNQEYPLWKDKKHWKYVSISNHRKIDVRNENRATFLARAYLNGQSYESVEFKRRPEKEHFFDSVLLRVHAMVNKYKNTSTPISLEQVKQWAQVKATQ